MKTKILEDVYGIKFVDFIDNDEKKDADGNEIVAMGEIRPMEQEIEFIKNLKVDIFHRCFVHEHVHAMLIALGMSDINTEDNVERLTTGILSFLNNNYYYECKIKPE